MGTMYRELRRECAPGASDVLTWTVERESATVTEANAATEVVMPLDTLRMLADQLYTVLMILVEGESETRSTSSWALDLEKVWKPGGVYTNVGTP